eukprot:scaffold7831_cov65-Skeletonema_dohrnii-CCMP3373.AAC.1
MMGQLLLTAGKEFMANEWFMDKAGKESCRNPKSSAKQKRALRGQNQLWPAAKRGQKGYRLGVTSLHLRFCEKWCGPIIGWPRFTWGQLRTLPASRIELNEAVGHR